MLYIILIALFCAEGWDYIPFWEPRGKIHGLIKIHCF